MEVLEKEKQLGLVYDLERRVQSKGRERRVRGGIRATLPWTTPWTLRLTPRETKRGAVYLFIYVNTYM